VVLFCLVSWVILDLGGVRGGGAGTHDRAGALSDTWIRLRGIMHTSLEQTALPLLLDQFDPLR
jgi:hypothetical protein